MNIWIFHFHKWGKWEQYEFTGKLSSILFRYEGPIEVFHYQKRICLECGKLQKEEIK